MKWNAIIYKNVKLDQLGETVYQKITNQLITGAFKLRDINSTLYSIQRQDILEFKSLKSHD